MSVFSLLIYFFKKIVNAIEYDRETGLYYVSSRYYDPEIGRFINSDAFVSTGQGILGHNMFVYCSNNPINRIDFTGYYAVSIFEGTYIEGLIEFGVWLKEQYKHNHYSRNNNNIQSPNLDLLEIVKGENEDWYRVDDKYNKYHRFTNGKQGEEAKYNTKYMTQDNRMEIIICYDPVEVPTPYIVTDPKNLGTYNYGTNKLSHILLDVLPYWFFGNSPLDTTKPWDRIGGN